MKFRIRIIPLLLILTMALSTVALAAPQWEGFEKDQTYRNQFRDVPASQWYAPYVKEVYEYGLMNGRSDTEFAPDGTVTYAEVITLAARIHAAWYGREAELEGFLSAPHTTWYEPYVTYAFECGFITYGHYAFPEHNSSKYNQPAYRRDVAVILCGSLDVEVLRAINDLDGVNIPEYNGDGSIDDHMGTAGYIRPLYEAGILTGNDKYGSFQGGDLVKRSEVAALAVRIVDPGMRKQFTLVQPVKKTPLEVLLGNYWQNYGVTLGTQGYLRFFPDGTCVTYYRHGEYTSTYTLKNGVLNIKDYGLSNMAYDPATGVFGKDMSAEIQGMWMTTDALSPAAQADFDRFMADRYE